MQARAPSLVARRRLLAIGAGAGLVAALLSGCAGPRAKFSDASRSRGHWSGRLSLNVDSQPPEQFYASFDLQGSADAGQLALYSPVGSTIALLRWRLGEAVLQQGGQSRDYGSVEALAAAVTGTPIPIRSLFSWLHGEDADVAGWSANLDELDKGRMSAQRHQPAPAARLRVILQDDGA